MSEPPIFDGPRRIRRSEYRASDRLSRICFNPGSVPEEEQDSFPEPLEQQDDEEGQTIVIAAGGRLVSQISIFHERIQAFDGLVRAGCIGGVCTHPDYRGYGLATRLMEDCTRRLVEGGARLMVISGGRGLYTRLGSAPVGKHAHFTLHPGQLRLPERAVTLRPISPADAAFCSRLYHAEPVRYHRPLAGFRYHFDNYQPGYHQEEWIVELDGHPAAYLLLTNSWDDAPERGIRWLDEYAGSRLALASALAAAIDGPHGLQELNVPVPWQDSDLIRLLVEAGGSPGWTSMPAHTMRLINFPGLMTDLRPYLRARLAPAQLRGLRFEQAGPLLAGSGGDCFTIRRGRDCLELDGAAMTALVMGAPEPPPPAPGALAEILPALFPLPSFLSGLNYH